MSESHMMPNVYNYKSREEVAPKYRYMRIPLNNITGTTTQLTTGAQQLLEFKLPIGVYNLARSKLLYMPVITAGGGTTVIATFEDVFDLAQNAYFGSGAGLGLCDLNYVNNWSKISRPAQTKLADFLDRDVQSTMYPSAIGYNGGAITENVYPVVYTTPANNQDVYGGAGNSYEAITQNTEPQHIAYAGGSGTANVAQGRPRQFALNDIKDTIYSVDKDLFWPIEMYARFLAGPISKMGFLIGGPLATPDTAATNIATVNIYNIFLFLAVEQNEIIVDSVKRKTMEGRMKLQIPYTTCFRIPSATSAVNFQIPLNRNYGKRLKRVIWSVFNGANAEALANAYDNSNWFGSKITSYQTYLDSRPLQDFQLQCAQPNVAAGAAGTVSQVINGDDWRENERFLKGSVIQNYGMFQQNFHHNDYFCEPNKNTNTPDENIDEGLDMDTTHLWQVQAVAPNANPMVNYVYATFVRDLTIHPSGSPSLDA